MSKFDHPTNTWVQSVGSGKPLNSLQLGLRYANPGKFGMAIGAAVPRPHPWEVGRKAEEETGPAPRGLWLQNSAPLHHVLGPGPPGAPAPWHR